MTQWAHPTFLGIEVNRLSGVDTLPTQRVPSPAPSAQGLLTPERVEAALAESQSHLSPSIFRSSSYFSVSSAQSPTPSTSASPPPASPTGELSGIYFGILNIYTTIPQFIGAVMSGIVFAVLDPGKSPELSDDVDATDPERVEGPNAIGVALFIGAACTLVSAYNTRKLRYIE
jgi:solute carrier family 45 protein 1/2/4